MVMLRSLSEVLAFSVLALSLQKEDDGIFKLIVSL